MFFLYGFLNLQNEIKRKHTTIGIQITDTSNSIFKSFNRLKKGQKKILRLEEHLIFRRSQRTSLPLLSYATAKQVIHLCTPATTR